MTEQEHLLISCEVRASGWRCVGWMGRDGARGYSHPSFLHRITHTHLHPANQPVYHLYSLRVNNTTYNRHG